MQIKEINHIALFVQDLAKSIHFYQEILALPLVPRPAFDFDGAWFALGKHTLHLIAGRNDESIVGGARSYHFAVEVHDIHACEAFLRSKNITLLGPKKRPDGAPQIFIQDPDGYWIEFTSMDF